MIADRGLAVRTRLDQYAGKLTPRAALSSIAPWCSLVVMIAFSMHSIWTELRSTSPVPHGPRSTAIALMAQALSSSREAAVGLTATLEALPPDHPVVIVNEQNDRLALLQYIVRYLTWPRPLDLINCEHPTAGTVVPAESAVVLTDSGRASVRGEVHPITDKVALVDVAAGPESVTCS